MSGNTEKNDYNNKSDRNVFTNFIEDKDAEKKLTINKSFLNSNNNNKYHVSKLLIVLKLFIIHNDVLVFLQ